MGNLPSRSPCLCGLVFFEFKNFLPGGHDYRKDHLLLFFVCSGFRRKRNHRKYYFFFFSKGSSNDETN